MSTKHAGNQKGSSDTHRIRDNYIHLGVDQSGASHVYRTSDETIFAIEADGTRSYRFDVSDMSHRAADDYVAHVGDARGWADCQFGFSAFLDRLTGAV
jgi:hypothetical protein